MQRLRSICLVFIFGCGTALTPEQACGEYAKQQCALIDTCTHEGVALGYPDGATCVERRTASCVASQSSPDTGNTPQATQTCAKALQSESCMDWLEGNAIAGCEVQDGTRFDGDPCMFNSECSSGFCGVALGDSCGSCAALPQVGDECEDQGCGPGLKCTSNKQCAAYQQLGESCDADHPCEPRTWCVTPLGFTAGTCTASIATIGAPCDPKKHTAPGCDSTVGLYCNTVSSTCGALRYVPAGQPCGATSDGGLADCIGGSTCRSGVCLADAADGGACDTAIGPSCMSPSRCVTDGVSTAGTCLFPDPDRCTP
jgi:hypothetical protein